MSLHVVTPSGCWLWQGHVYKGYGQLRGTTAHRTYYKRLVGPIPEGMELDHLCRVPLCVNPAHLEPVTPAENKRRQLAALTHCKHGHEFTPENTHTLANGRRQCRACGRARSAAYKKRKQEVTA